LLRLKNETDDMYREWKQTLCKSVSLTVMSSNDSWFR